MNASPSKLMAAASAVLCAGVCGVWAWAAVSGGGERFRFDPERGTVTNYGVTSDHAWVTIALWRGPPPESGPVYVSPGSGGFKRWEALGAWYDASDAETTSAGGRARYYGERQEYGAMFWTLAIIAGLPAAGWATATARRRARAAHRLRRGCCPSCGYDLRGTPERCPECGAIPAAKGERA